MLLEMVAPAKSVLETLKSFGLIGSRSSDREKFDRIMAPLRANLSVAVDNYVKVFAPFTFSLDDENPAEIGNTIKAFIANRLEYCALREEIRAKCRALKQEKIFKNPKAHQYSHNILNSVPQIFSVISDLYVPDGRMSSSNYLYHLFTSLDSDAVYRNNPTLRKMALAHQWVLMRRWNEASASFARLELTVA